MTIVLNEAKSVVLYWFHKAVKSTLLLSLPMSGLTFVTKDLNMATIYFSHFKI